MILMIRIGCNLTARADKRVEWKYGVDLYRDWTMDTLENGPLQNDNNQISCNHIGIPHSHSLYWYQLTNKIANGNEIKPTNTRQLRTIIAATACFSNSRSIIHTAMEGGLKIVSDQIDDINKVPRERSAINCLFLSAPLRAHNASGTYTEIAICRRWKRYKHLNMVRDCTSACCACAAVVNVAVFARESRVDTTY